MAENEGVTVGPIEEMKVEDNRYAVCVEDVWYSRFLTDYKGNKVEEAPDWLDYGVEARIEWKKNPKGFYNIVTITKTGVQGTVQSGGKTKSPQKTLASASAPERTYKTAMHPDERASIERQKALDLANQLVIATDIPKECGVIDSLTEVRKVFDEYIKLIQGR